MASYKKLHIWIISFIFISVLFVNFLNINFLSFNKIIHDKINFIQVSSFNQFEDIPNDLIPKINENEENDFFNQDESLYEIPRKELPFNKFESYSENNTLNNLKKIYSSVSSIIETSIKMVFSFLSVFDLINLHFDNIILNISNIVITLFFIGIAVLIALNKEVEPKRK